MRLFNSLKGEEVIVNCYRDNNDEQESYTVKACVLAQFVSRQALAQTFQNPRVTYSCAYVKVSFWQIFVEVLEGFPIVFH